MTATNGQPEALGPGEMDAWIAFLQAATLALEALDKALDEHDITLSDYEILVWLSESPDRRLAMSDLANNVLMPKSRLTYRVDRLEQAGFVERQACPDDARRIWATLTATGYKALQKAWPDHLASVREFVIDPINRRDLAATTRSLQGMVDALGGLRLPARPT